MKPVLSAHSFANLLAVAMHLILLILVIGCCASLGNCSDKSSIGNACECGLFDETHTISPNDEPLLKQQTIDVMCDDAGEDKCAKLCTALAKASREQGPKIVCNQLGHYDQLKASVYSRIGCKKSWKFTGVTSPEDICCHDKQSIKCSSDKDVEDANTVE